MAIKHLPSAPKMPTGRPMLPKPVVRPRMKPEMREMRGLDRRGMMKRKRFGRSMMME